MKTESIVLAKRPEGIPSDDVFRYETIEIDEPGNDEIQVEAIYISIHICVAEWMIVNLIYNHFN